MKEETQETAIVPTTQTTTAIPEPTARLVEKSFAENTMRTGMPAHYTRTQFAEQSAIARFKDGKSR